MRALSLWQPWASLIYDGRKTIETRHWEMLHRGPLAIHAAMKVDKDACAEFGYDWKAIPRGAVLCIVSVQGCVRFGPTFQKADKYGDFTEGRFGILMQMLKKFEFPLIVKGHQGIWHWDEKAEYPAWIPEVGLTAAARDE